MAAALAGHGLAALLVLTAEVSAPQTLERDPVEIVFAEATPAASVAEPATPELAQPLAEPPPQAAPTPELASPPPPEPPPPEPPLVEPLPAPAPPVAAPRPPPPRPLPRPSPPPRPAVQRAAPPERATLAQPAAPAPPLAPTSALAAPPTPERAGIDPGWRSSLNGWLAARKRYPAAAEAREIEGAVGVSFTVTRDGRVEDPAITRSSGFAVLDEAVLTMLAGEQAPPFPPAMPQDRARISVTIRYRLDR